MAYESNLSTLSHLSNCNKVMCGWVFKHVSIIESSNERAIIAQDQVPANLGSIKHTYIHQVPFSTVLLPLGSGSVHGIWLCPWAKKQLWFSLRQIYNCLREYAICPYVVDQLRSRLGSSVQLTGKPTPCVLSDAIDVYTLVNQTKSARFEDQR